MKTINNNITIKINGETPRPELIVKGIGFLCKRSYIDYEDARRDSMWIEHLFENMEVEYTINRTDNYIVIYVNNYSAVKRRYDIANENK